MNGKNKPILEPKSFSIQYFCIAHGISRATFYNLIKKQLAPRLMKVGRRTLISSEAAAEWRIQMEKNTEESR